MGIYLDNDSRTCYSIAYFYFKNGRQSEINFVYFWNYVTVQPKKFS